MKKIILFDFNKTLYDPHKKELMNGCLDILKLLSSKHILILISNQKCGRKDLIDKLIGKYFRETVLCNEKNEHEFKAIISKYDSHNSKCFVVGDTLDEEITIGKKLGCKTIHLNSNDKPTTADYSIKNLEELRSIII